MKRIQFLPHRKPRLNYRDYSNSTV